MKSKAPHAHRGKARPALGSLARALVQARHLTEEDAAALDPGNVTRALVSHGKMNAADLARFVSQTFGYPRVALDAFELSPQHVLPADPLRDMLLASGVLPLARHGNRLTLAMTDPTAPDLLDTLRQETGFEIDAVVADMTSLQEAIAQLTRPPLTEAPGTVGPVD